MGAPSSPTEVCKYGRSKRFSNRWRYGCGLLVVLALLTARAENATVAPPVRILALGDSLTAGYGLAAADSFPAQLERHLRDRGYLVEIINAGVSGDTTTGGLARLDWILADDPDLVILALGANDGLRAIDPDLTRSNLDRMLSTITERGIPVLLVGMYAPPNLGKAYVAQFNATFPELAEKYQVTFYPFFLDGVAAIQELNQEDGIHPNAAGVQVIVERIAPYLTPMIEGVPREQP